VNHIKPGRTIVWPNYLGDMSVLVDRGNAIESSMLNETYDADVVPSFTRFVKPGHYCIDVGANVGAVTLHLARLVGSQGHVVAVEPGPPYCARMTRNLELNPTVRDRVTMVNAGVGETSGTLRWQADPNAPFNAMLFDHRPWPAANTEVLVPVETLDDLVIRLRLPRVDFIKIDVESMELEVLRGVSWFSLIWKNRLVELASKGWGLTTQLASLYS